MAAATSLDEGAFQAAVRTKGRMVERSRPRVQGAHGRSFESREAAKQRDRDAERLDDGERRDLLYLWSGVDAAMGVRSTMGATYDRLMLSPPRMGKELEREALRFLQRHSGGAPVDKVVEVLAAENVGATRHEARMAIRRMLAAGRAVKSVESVVRKRACTCRSPMGEVEGSRRQREACGCSAGAEEAVPVEVVRLVADSKKWQFPPEVPAAERWARADAELEADCHRMVCGSGQNAASGSRLPPHVHTGKADAVRSALRRIGPEHRRVIERVYGGSATPQWSGLTERAARLAAVVPCVEAARRNPGSGRVVLASDVLRGWLDSAPDVEVARIRWRLAKDGHIARIERESAKMERDAVEAFREARG